MKYIETFSGFINLESTACIEVIPIKSVDEIYICMFKTEHKDIKLWSFNEWEKALDFCIIFKRLLRSFIENEMKISITMNSLVEKTLSEKGEWKNEYAAKYA